jgi:hypothetical protein
VELSHAEPGRRAVRLFRARGGELSPGGDVGEIADPFGAIGRDYEMSLASFSREARQQRADDALVIGVSEDCEDWAAGLSLCVRRVRGGHGQRHGDESIYRYAHAIHCSLEPQRARPGQLETSGFI